MGSVGNFLFGGSKEKNNSLQTSQSQSTSDQNSTNASAQQSVAGNTSTNRAYEPLSAALTSNLGNVSSASNMMGALLGLPPSTFNYATAPVPKSAPMPTAPVSATDLIQYLTDAKPTAPVAHVPTPPPTPPTAGAPPVSNPVSNPTSPIPGGLFNHRMEGLDPTYLARRENGGPVTAGQPYVVGEKRPEVFVPHTSGTIVPSVPQAQSAGFGVAAPAPSAYSGSNPYNPSPGNANDALNTFSNSSGMNFILDQGQKAISGASAGNGTFNSGATGKALEQYGQNIGKSYLQNYMDNLKNYANIGLGSASALTGSGGTSIGQSTQASGSIGNSTGTSQSTSSGLGTSSGDSNSKKGLVPDILG